MAADRAEIYMQSALAITREDDLDKLETACRYQLEHVDQTKWPIGLQAFENASYLLGNHLTRFYYTANSGFGFHQFGIHDHSQFDNLVAKSADNKLIRPTENVASMLAVDEPYPRVKPNSEDPADEDAADIAGLIVDTLWQNPLNMDQLTRDAALLGCVVPSIAIEIEYGPTGQPMTVPRTESAPDPITGEDVEQAAEGEEVVYRQDFRARLWNYFHLQPDPYATCEDDLTWIARTSYEDVDWVRDNFDLDLPGYRKGAVEGLKAPGGSAEKSILYWWSKFQDIIPSPQYYQHGAGLSPRHFASEGGMTPNQVKFTVIDVKPSAEHPEGRTIIMADETLIYAGPARSWSRDYPWRWHPYAFWGWFKLPGKFWATPLLTQLVPLQKKINAIDALVHANRQFISVGQWLVPEHCDIPDGYFSGIPAQEIKYNDVPGQAKPERIRNEPLPGDLLQERVQLERSIEWIAGTGLGDPSMSPSANRSAAQMQFAERARLQAKMPMLRSFQRMVEKCAQNLLIDVQINLKRGDPELAARLQAAAAGHASLHIQNFSAASLRDHHDVKIDIISRQFNTPEVRAQKAMEFWQFSGGQVLPHEREGLLRAMDFDEFAKTAENDSVVYARRLISRIREGHIDPQGIDEAQLSSLLMPGIAKASAMGPLFTREILSDRFHDLDDGQKHLVMKLNELLQMAAQQEHAAQMDALAQQSRAQSAGQLDIERVKAEAKGAEKKDQPEPKKEGATDSKA